MKHRAIMSMAVLSLIVRSISLSAEEPAGKNAEREEAGQEDYVTREEYEALKKELEAQEAKISELVEKETSTTDEAARTEGFLQDLANIRDLARSGQIGSTKFLLTGDAAAGFTAPEKSKSSFSAEFGPLFLWQLNDRVLLETGLDFSISGSGGDASTDVDLVHANISYLINDYLAVGAGRFPVQFGIYHDHLDPSWINKLPDDPLALGDGGISPDLGLGVFATGAAPAGPVAVNYSIYGINGPALITDDPESAGSLSFENFDDINHNKAVGARLGFLPIPELEVGYSIQYAIVNPSGFRNVDALLQAVDLNYVQVVNEIRGRVTCRLQWVFSHVEQATYDPGGTLGFGPLAFNNNREGGFVEVAYRPTLLEIGSLDFIKDLEIVFRYDRLDISATAPGGGHEERWTPGIDYWITPSMVLKVAYEFDHNKNGPDQDATLVQVGIGF